MRRELEARSKHKVRFIKEVVDATQTSASVESAREQMLQQSPRKNDPKALKQEEPEKSPLEQIGFTAEEADAIEEACYTTASQLRSWFLDCNDNAKTVLRYMEDNGIQKTAEGFGKSMDYLYSNSHLIRKQRKRGDPVIRQYISPSQTPQVNKRREAEQLSLAELKEIERKRQVEARKRLRLPPGHIF